MIFCVVVDDYGDRWKGIYLCSHCWCLCWLLLFYLVDVIEQILMEKGGESRKEKGCKVQIH